ncbi:MAG TPA: EAL domain-containing protein [Treponemataceae bacterium]|nr:EAL domain-containing protein [Treponemataceae bacterium]
MVDGTRKPDKFFLISERKPTWRTALKIALIYLAFSVFWIFFSDSLLALMVQTPDLITQISIAKGIVFVLMSALIIYMMVAPALHKISDNEQVIMENRNELKILLYYDHLTGLSNRRKLIERLPEYLEDQTSKGKGLLFIDIDNIKLINDTMGHAFGDLLIAETAKRLKTILEPPEEIFRIGGDEFLILTKFSQITGLKSKTEAIIHAFDEPIPIQNALIHNTVSVGISLYPMHSTDPGELLKCADIAMYQAKNCGKNTATLYNVNMMTSINDRMNIGEYLHDALTNGELEVFYQPQITTDTGRISSFEALLRWNNRVLGRVSPDKFIGVAEETHLIIPIGDWILRNSCRFLKKLHDQGYGELSISINISMIQLLQDDFSRKVARIIENAGLDPTRIELEITESALMESYTIIRGQLDELRKIGITIALDDFGKGYSSLSYLEQLPITTLKIDKSFVDRISDPTNDTSITGNIVKIGKKLGLTVIAEGVETDSQLAFLASQQCDKIQGWVYSKALPESDAEAFVVHNLQNVARKG